MAFRCHSKRRFSPLPLLTTAAHNWKIELRRVAGAGLVMVCRILQRQDPLSCRIASESNLRHEHTIQPS